MKTFGGGKNTKKTKQLNKKNPNQKKFPNPKTTLQNVKHISISGSQGLWTTQDSACTWNTKMQILTAMQSSSAEKKDPWQRVLVSL